MTMSSQSLSTNSLPRKSNLLQRRGAMMGLKPSFSDLSHGIGGLLEWSKLFGSSSWIRTCGCERMGGTVQSTVNAEDHTSQDLHTLSRKGRCLNLLPSN